MTLANFGDLKTAVKAWSKRTELTDAVLADFITLAHTELMGRARVRAMEVRDSAYILTSETTALPTRFREFRSVVRMSTPSQSMQLVSPQWASEAYSRATTDLPSFYLIEGGTFRSVPAPSASTTLEIVYYAAFADFSVDADTNWILTNYPGLYLFGALIKLAPYIGNDDRVGTWETEFEKLLLVMHKEDRKANWSGSVSGQRVKFAP